MLPHTLALSLALGLSLIVGPSSSGPGGMASGSPVNHPTQSSLGASLGSKVSPFVSGYHPVPQAPRAHPCCGPWPTHKNSEFYCPPSVRRSIQCSASATPPSSNYRQEDDGEDDGGIAPNLLGAGGRRTPIEASAGSFFEDPEKIAAELSTNPRIATTLMYMISNHRALLEELEAESMIGQLSRPSPTQRQKGPAQGEGDLPVSSENSHYFDSINAFYGIRAHSRENRDRLRQSIREFPVDLEPLAGASADAADGAAGGMSIFGTPSSSTDEESHPPTSPARMASKVADCLYKNAHDYENLLESLVLGASSTMSRDVQDSILTVIYREREGLRALNARQLIHRRNEDYQEGVCMMPIKPQFSMVDLEAFLKASGNTAVKSSSQRGGRVDPLLLNILKAAMDVLSMDGGRLENAEEPANPDDITNYRDPGFFDQGYAGEDEAPRPQDPSSGYQRDPETGVTTFTPRPPVLPTDLEAARELSAIGKDIFYLELFHHTMIEEAYPPHLSQPWKWYEHFEQAMEADGIRVYQSKVSPSLHRSFRDAFRTFLGAQLRSSIDVGYKLTASCLRYEAERYAAFLTSKLRVAKYVSAQDREYITTFIRATTQDIADMGSSRVVGNLDKESGKKCIQSIMAFFGSKFP